MNKKTTMNTVNQINFMRRQSFYLYIIEFQRCRGLPHVHVFLILAVRNVDERRINTIESYRAPDINSMGFNQ